MPDDLPAMVVLLLFVLGAIALDRRRA